jgi:ATP-dependent DNA helicase RecQ
MATDSIFRIAFQKASEAVCSVFGITALYDKQKEALESFFCGRNVFVNLPTSYGKSLIFQAVPIMADIIHKKDKGSSIMVVVSPLKSLMEDQVRALNKLNIPAVCVTDTHDDCLIQKIINGEFTHIYGSPECFLSSTWRGILSTSRFKDSLVCVAVDEAHCISQW